MSDYVLKVRYREDEEPVSLTLIGCNADEAEAARQELAKQIEHARDLEAPLIYPSSVSAGSRVAIDPARVTSVDLVDDL